MSSSDESDFERRSSDEEEDEKIDEDKEEVASPSQDASPSPSPSPVRYQQKLSSRSKSASLNALAFPISRVRRLVKSEGDMQWVSVEAGFLIAKAAPETQTGQRVVGPAAYETRNVKELFLEKFAEDTFEKMTEDESTTLHYKDLAVHVSSTERMDFLADIVPEMIQASAALSAKANADK